MSSETIQPGEYETTGRYIVTFREGAHNEGAAALSKHAGVSKGKLASSTDFGNSGVDMSQIAQDGGVVLEHLGIAVVNIDPDAAGALSQEISDDSSIIAIEPEGIVHAFTDVTGLTLEYLKGFRDAATSLYASAVPERSEEFEGEVAALFNDTASLTWGLQATKVGNSRYTGQGISVAILDTGLFLAHPDFQGRQIVGKSFIPGVSTVNDGHGHGTHCAGTACGPLKPGVGRRYGIAHKSNLYIGKVLSDQGSGNDGGILAGIEWAVANRVQVISMSLGANVQTSTVAYETAGQRALNNNTLIVAAAGNNANRASAQFGYVTRPANSRTFLAVGALTNQLGIGYFSARDTVRAAGTAVDIAGPGVDVYSSWPMPTRTRTLNGTSMATPHVAGVAALWAQATGARGAGLWQQLIVNSRGLLLPNVDVGRGLVQAP